MVFCQASNLNCKIIRFTKLIIIKDFPIGNIKRNHIQIKSNFDHRGRKTQAGIYIGQTILFRDVFSNVI